MENLKYDYLGVINYILEKYEIGETFWILTGLEVAGIENYKIWLDFVEYTKETEYFEYLPSYILIMKKILREDEVFSLDNLFKSNEFKTSNEIYSRFMDMLNKICIKNEEKTKTKK